MYALTFYSDGKVMKTMKKMVLFVLTLIIFFSSNVNVKAAETQSDGAEQTKYYMKNTYTGELKEMSYTEFVEVTGGDVSLTTRSSVMPALVYTWWEFTPTNYSTALYLLKG